MQEIDVEKIMQEIRQEIAKKGMKEPPVEFRDFNGEYRLPQSLDEELFKKELINLNTLWDTAQVLEVKGGNQLKLFIKKIIYKMMMLVLRPYITVQTVFNSTVVSTINQLQCLHEENKKLKEEIKELRETVGKEQ